jgi:dinuclear metal center YbgI/SA1388 family protein
MSEERLMAERDAIVSFLDEVLRTSQIKDSSCNGLQVQGAMKVARVALVVDACLEAYEKAHAAGCQMVIAHHGLIWNGLTSISGRVYRHVHCLMQHDLNLYASHLPLDMHEEYGNNIGLARLLGLEEIKPFGAYHGIMIGYQGKLVRTATAQELAARLAREVGGRPRVLENGPREVRSVGIVSGGAADSAEQAAAAKLDCFVTGEPAHFSFQLARELETNVVFLGHYHSEKLGVQALGKLLTAKLGVECEFMDVGAFSAEEYVD